MYKDSDKAIFPKTTIKPDRTVGGGFLVITLREEDIISIGDTLLIVSRIGSNQVRLAIKAKKDLKIDRIERPV